MQSMQVCNNAKYAKYASMQQCKVGNNAVPCKVENESGGNGVNSGSVYNTM